MSILFGIAALLGTDPVTLVVLGAMSAVCAHILGRMAANPWSGAFFLPLLMAGGLAADDGAVALGLYQGFDVGLGNQTWEANWPMISEGLPNVLVAATAGMSATALLLVGAMRLRQSLS